MFELFHAILLQSIGSSTYPSKDNYWVEIKNILVDSVEDTAIVFWVGLKATQVIGLLLYNLIILSKIGFLMFAILYILITPSLDPTANN